MAIKFCNEQSAALNIGFEDCVVPVEKHLSESSATQVDPQGEAVQVCMSIMYAYYVCLTRLIRIVLNSYFLFVFVCSCRIRHSIVYYPTY